MAKKKTNIPDEMLQQYDKIVNKLPDQKVKGAANRYTSLNGHMFSFINNNGDIGLRLPKEEREAFIKKYDSKIMEQYGRNMPEYVVVTDELFMKTRTMNKYFKISHEYIQSLKPKPTTKKKSK